MWSKMLHGICNMATRGLPDIYILILLASSVHIGQTTHAYVTNTNLQMLSILLFIVYFIRSNNYLYLHFKFFYLIQLGNHDVSVVIGSMTVENGGKSSLSKEVLVKTHTVGKCYLK